MPSKTTPIKASTIKTYNQIVGGDGKFSWKPGVISLVAEDRLPIGAATLAVNMMQTQDGVWSTRWGSKNYGALWDGPVTGFQEFSYGGTNYYAIIDNGAFKYASDGGAWTTVSGNTWDTSAWTNMVQYENKLLLCNGVDSFSYIDLATFTYVGFNHIDAPSGVTLTISSGLSATNPVTTLYYQITAITKVGETLPSTVASQDVNIDRNNWYNPNAAEAATSTLFITAAWTAPSDPDGDIIGYNIYISDGVEGITYYLDSTNQTRYTDYGSSAINDFIEVPVDDTTTAPSFSWLALSDNRLWACGDPNNLWRIYWAGTGPQYNTAFSPYAGGGWVDILPGSPQQPHWVGQFRNGQGNPMTTILTEEASGYGSTWHCQLSTDTIGNTVITVPTLVQSLSTFGTSAPRAVVQTNENVYFHSGGPAGIYSTGSISTLFNVLATNEISIMIRRDIQAITLSALQNECGIEYDRKIWLSVPYGSTTNNRIMIWDLEKENWNPYAFDFGVDQFIRYVDNEGEIHLLALPTDPTAGNYLVELNEDYLDDNGVPFQAHLQTGLIHIDPSHIQFAQIQYVYYELGSPQGNITLAFSGTPKNLPLSTLASYPITEGDIGSGVGFSTYPFSAVPFSFVDGAPLTSGALSVKKRLRLNRLLNNWEGDISSKAVGTKWTINQIVATGFVIPTAAPSDWVIN